MNLIYYIFFVVYFFSTLNHVESRLSHVKVTHRNGAKIYTVGGKQFKTFRNAHKHNKRRSKLLRKKSIRRPTRRLTRKNTRRQINRIIKRRPTSKSNRFQSRFQPLMSRHQPTQPPIIATTTTKVDKIAETLKAYYKEINEHREKHSAAPLKVSAELVKRAEDGAKTFSKDKKTPESVFEKYVRNCVVFRDFSDNPVAYWYRQKDNHNFTDPEHKELSEGFIHMLWKAATDVGCGMIYNNEEYFVCCEFSPVENVKDKKEIKKNVLEE
uniref:SCP domain-containing protein n=1 Tax=Strongyloides stercoralis TaxID=6248 RepID=A0A0K0EGA8_STRER